MIPINEAIEAGAWLQIDKPIKREDRVSSSITFIYDEIVAVEPRFKFKLISFSKVDLTTIDNPENLKVSVDCNFWLLKFELVVLLKESAYFSNFVDMLKLSDDEGYQFEAFDWTDDFHLCSNSDFAKSSGLASLNNMKISPKIRKTGALIFELPDEFDTLFITVKDGEISEV